ALQFLQSSEQCFSRAMLGRFFSPPLSSFFLLGHDFVVSLYQLVQLSNGLPSLSRLAFSVLKPFKVAEVAELGYLLKHKAQVAQILVLVGAKDLHQIADYLAFRVVPVDAVNERSPT